MDDAFKVVFSVIAFSIFLVTILFVFVNFTH